MLPHVLVSESLVTFLLFFSTYLSHSSIFQFTESLFSSSALFLRPSSECSTLYVQLTSGYLPSSIIISMPLLTFLFVETSFQTFFYSFLKNVEIFLSFIESRFLYCVFWSCTPYPLILPFPSHHFTLFLSFVRKQKDLE